MENKDNVDNNNNEFSDNNDRNVKQPKVNQDLKKKKRLLNRAENQLMDNTISAGDDHIHDQHEYPNDYVDDDEDFGLADHDSLHNIDFQIDAEHKNEFIYDEADETIADNNIDLQKEQSHVTHDYVSPGGLSYWIPVVSDHIKTKIKYDMVFVPFTRIDNHKKCVTFDVVLLSREYGTSYSWLLRAFLKTLKKQLTLVLTDQDPTLNKVVNEVFPMSPHRRNQLVNDFNTATTVPRFITSSPNKPHASKVYTRKKNYQAQKEISDSDNTCFQMSVTSCNGIDTIIVLEKQKNISTVKPSSPVGDDNL
ncbi:unnamed protein product [Lactuca saligna]|uniref:MULE transposase domain-containing protein n=1 Tax=Lactuca saligna TaxID=75948 RepID=A0AA36EEN8_LACSI|nr:unnamed protein product [Lactuca saligna]